MHSYRDVDELRARFGPAVTGGPPGRFAVEDAGVFQGPAMDELVHNAVFNADPATVTAARALITAVALETGAKPGSIRPLYLARGRGEWSGATVPALNLRGLTYDLARVVFRVAKRNDAAAMIFELARSEVGYTWQRPAEYAACVLAAAVREGWLGPVFLQGDHYQVSARKHADPSLREAELDSIRQLIGEALACGTWNIDLDSSTLVDLTQPTRDRQQRTNYEVCAELTDFIRRHQPDGVVSIGGEIGEVGRANSTVEELVAFMDGYTRVLGDRGPGLSKISVQTGTSHGGVPLPDGTLREVRVDFDTLRELSRVARSEYGLAGAVQHGASTLPSSLFHRFPEVETAEIHLATGLQNIVFDHAVFPAELRSRMSAWCKRMHADEWKPGQTEAQFLYKTRKKAWGPFKEELWGLDMKPTLCAAVEEEIERWFGQLGILGTRELVERHVGSGEAPPLGAPPPTPSP